MDGFERRCLSIAEMARTRSENFPEIQRSILKRAAAVFAKVGYASSSINDLVEATELSRGALYHYFPSKEAILCGILDYHVQEFLDNIDQAMYTSRVAIEQLRSVTKAIVAFNTRSRNEQVIILNDINQLSEIHRERMKGLERRILERLSDLLMRVDAEGRITPSNKRIYTMMYLGIINYTFAWYDPQGPVKPDEYADLATDLFLNGLLSAAPTQRLESAPPQAITRAKKTGTAKT
jgi:AcrR family transcriptional regulator